MPKQIMARFVNEYICALANKVIVCSNYASYNCSRYMPTVYKKAEIFPLIFDDDCKTDLKIKRKFFSLIGGYSNGHGSDLFLDFAKKAYKNDKDIFFSIVTRDNIEQQIRDPFVQEMQNVGRLSIQMGRPLTVDEMSEAYRSSICTWTAYRRSTQSGVLANSFMQGTPVIATKLGSFEEFIVSGENGMLIDDYSFEAIYEAYARIVDNLNYMEAKCRKTFLNEFYYKNQQEAFLNIIKSME